MDKPDSLVEQAKVVLAKNDRGNFTVPAGDLYPHQWLWDSCFIAIGQRHYDLPRAQTEILNLLSGQWANGMLPNIIFLQASGAERDKEVWQSYLSPYAPRHVATSGLTQPPMLAEAVVRIGQKLKSTERRTWYNQALPHLMAYHEWLYAERDPHKEGLVILLHPYESGTDSSPPWISELRKHSLPAWIKFIELAHLDGVVNRIRRDTRHLPPGQRISNIEAMGYWAALRRLRRKAYNSEAILNRPLFAVQDLAFNCILIRANQLLKEVAEYVRQPLSETLSQAMAKSQDNLEQLWDEQSQLYFSRSFLSHKLIKEPTITTLLPLYAGCLDQPRAQTLVDLLKRRKFFGANFPVPSVPLDSRYFDPDRYWQGPTWLNMNWLIIDGLSRNGFNEEAEQLRAKSLELVKKSGFYEYFNPLTGQPAGAPNFSWTAALTVDLLAD